MTLILTTIALAEDVSITHKLHVHCNDISVIAEMMECLEVIGIDEKDRII